MSREPKYKRLSRVWMFVAAIGPLLVFGGTRYFDAQSEKRDRIERLEQKLDEFLAKKQELEARPQVQVRVRNLEDSGLPEFAFRTLEETPLVVRIAHAGGGTARDISVLLSVSTLITSYRAEASLEDYKIELGESKRELKIQLERLRQGSAFECVVMCDGLCSSEFDYTIGSGIPQQPMAKVDQEKIDSLNVDGTVLLNAKQYKYVETLDAYIQRFRQLIAFEAVSAGKSKQTSEILGEITLYAFIGLLGVALGWLFGGSHRVPQVETTASGDTQEEDPARTEPDEEKRG